jgi:hypothetical protein
MLMYYFRSSFIAGNEYNSFDFTVVVIGRTHSGDEYICTVRLGVLSAQSQSSLPTSRPVYRPYKGTHVSIYINTLWIDWSRYHIFLRHLIFEKQADSFWGATFPGCDFILEIKHCSSC